MELRDVGGLDPLHPLYPPPLHGAGFGLRNGRCCLWRVCDDELETLWRPVGQCEGPSWVCEKFLQRSFCISGKCDGRRPRSPIPLPGPPMETPPWRPVVVRAVFLMGVQNWGSCKGLRACHLANEEVLLGCPKNFGSDPSVIWTNAAAEGPAPHIPYDHRTAPWRPMVAEAKNGTVASAQRRASDKTGIFV